MRARKPASVHSGHGSLRTIASVFFFRADISAFADTFLPDGVSPRVFRADAGEPFPRESSENNRRSNRAAGFYARRRFAPSNVSSSAASLVTSLTQFRARQRPPPCSEILLNHRPMFGSLSPFCGPRCFMSILARGNNRRAAAVIHTNIPSLFTR